MKIERTSSRERRDDKKWNARIKISKIFDDDVHGISDEECDIGISRRKA